MNILITGGLGYIGSVLIKKFLALGYKVTVLDNLIYKQIGSVYDCGDKNLNFVLGDVRDKNLLQKLVKENDVIIPLACIVGMPACEKNPELANAINYEQIKNIMDVISWDQKIVIPNTNSQYGSSTEIITEESPFKPLSLYAETKCDAEKCILDNGNGIALRLATVFGVSPRMRLDLLVNDFTYKSFTEGVLVLFESSFKRNYIHVNDVCKAFVHVIDNYETSNNNAFNVGLSSANLSKLELAEKIKEYIPSLVIKTDEFKKDLDQRNYIVSNEKIEKTGWMPDVSIDDGIQELIKAYKIIRNFNNKDFTNL